MKATRLLCLSAPQLHQIVLPPSTHDKIFWCCGAFFFLRDLQPGNRFAILHTYFDNFISRPDWIQRHDLAELRANLTTPLQNSGRNLIRMRTATPPSKRHCALPTLTDWRPFWNGNFQNGGKSKKQVSTCGHKFTNWNCVSRSGRTCWGVPSPNPAHSFALCAIFGCAAIT